MKFFSKFLGDSEPRDDTPADPSPDRADALAGQTPAPGAAAPNPDEGLWDFGALDTPWAPPSTAPAEPIVVDPAVTSELTPKVIEVIKTVFDPEIPVDIYELGLIYDISADAARRVHIRMTLTSPACPSAQQIPSEVQFKVKLVDGVSDATVDVVWEPPWDKDKMSETAKLTLGMF